MKKSMFLLRCVLILSCFELYSSISAQEFTPVVTQFSKFDYRASNQNWAVAQGSDGLLYFGNNKGLLQFDGSLWNLYPLPENKVVRSLCSVNNRIYVGSFEEFGYFERQESGELVYSSLMEHLKNYTMQNDEIWNIFEYKGAIVFQSFTSYFVYKNGHLSGVRCPYTFLFFSYVNNQIFTHTDQYGFGYFDLNSASFVPITGNEILTSPVIKVIPCGADSSLLATQSAGLFSFNGKVIRPFRTNVDTELKRSQINRALRLSDGTLFIGTILDGVIAINPDGTKKWSINTENVLKNNTVLGMASDKENNLWLAMDKGIAFVRSNDAMSYINAFTPSVGSIYSACEYQSDIFLGTNQGLYRVSFDQKSLSLNHLSLLSGIKGQVWDIKNMDGQLICGNNEETFEVNGTNVRPLSSVRGGICLKKGLIHGKEVLIQGTYTQLCVYVKDGNAWKFSHAIDGFVNPVRYLEIDYTGTIWAGHLHQGLYQINLTSDLRTIEKIRYYSSLDNFHNTPVSVFSFNNRVVFSDKRAFYTYDDIQKRIVRYTELNKQIGIFAQSYRIKHFKANLYWFIRESEAALVQVKAANIKILDVIHFAMFTNQIVDDYQNVITLSDNLCLFTLENGLLLYTFGSGTISKPTFGLQIKTVRTFNVGFSKDVYLTLRHSNAVPSTPYSRNNVIFTVCYPQFSNIHNVAYSYYLEGFDKIWSKSTESSQKEYNYLPSGQYTFRCKVYSKSGDFLAQQSYTFVVNPPFYLSSTAKIVYLLILIILLWMFYKLGSLLYRKKKEKIRFDQEQLNLHEVQMREQKIIELENEKLESELTLKSKELAVSTMTIINKNEVLLGIKEEIKSQKEILGSQYPNKYFDKLIRMLDDNLDSEDDWKIFQSNFDRIHENFFRNLHAEYPDLTSNDMRFCAYLRLNLSSKDIAHLMNISLKGVEVARSRLRKKLGIPSSKSLTEFMIEFK